MPSAAYIPGSWYWDRTFGRLALDDTPRDSRGRPEDLTRSIAASFGVKVRAIDVEQGYEIQIGALKKTISGFQEEMRQLNRERERKHINADDYLSERRHIEKQMQGLHKQIEELAKLRDKK
jgi:hypothetical protein